MKTTRSAWASLPGVMALAMLGAGLTPQPAAAGGPAVLDIADRRQVFIDGRFLAESKNVELQVHQPRKTGELTIRPEYPWEKQFGWYVSVLKAGQTYHMWYRGIDPASPGGPKTTICYARSEDGIHWEKPMLGLAEVNGSKQNNIVVGHGAGGFEDPGRGGMVFCDPNATEDAKFRFVLRHGRDLSILSSGDGIHWTLTHESVLADREGKVHNLDSANVIFWDDRINKYVAYARLKPVQHGSRSRSVVRGESDRLGGFGYVQDLPIVLGPDRLDLWHDDTEVVDYYTSATTKYPWAQDAYYMFPTAYYHYERGHLREFLEKAPVNTGPIHTQFAASRDGVKWHRFKRRPFVDLGMKGEFDSKAVFVGHGPVLSRDERELYLYYHGGDRLHGWDRDEAGNQLMTHAGLQPIQDITAISRVVLRRDGFISVRAAYTGGEFTTGPLRFKGSHLVLNVDTSATGILQVGILDEAGNPIDGYSVNECDRIHTSNEINRVVRWEGKSNVSKLADKPVRLRFVFRDADLYAFEFRG